MSDDPTGPTEEADNPTPENEAPDTGQAEATGNETEADLESFDLSQVPEDADREWFESQVKNLRSDYTRKTQTLAEQRKQVQEERAFVEAVRDPSNPKHAEALEALGLELAGDDDDEPDDFDDEQPWSKLEKEVAALKAEREREQMTAQEQARAEQLENILVERIDEVQNAEGREFSDPELRFILNYETGEDGLPDVQKGVEGLKQYLADQKKSWANSKKNPPRGPGGGVPGSRELDITDSATRQNLAAEVAAAAMRG